MLAEFTVFDTEKLSVEHLFDSPKNEKLISSFTVGKNAYGLESYLKNLAADDERNNFARTYLVKDKSSGELACYFSLRTGLITLQTKDDKFATVPAIELSNFATNDTYRKNHSEVTKLGVNVFEKFILPIAQNFSRYVGANSLCIYALPNDRLMDYYKNLGFTRLPAEQEKFVQVHVKPEYDEDCIFMYQTL